MKTHERDPLWRKTADTDPLICLLFPSGTLHARALHAAQAVTWELGLEPCSCGSRVLPAIDHCVVRVTANNPHPPQASRPREPQRCWRASVSGFLCAKPTRRDVYTFRFMQFFLVQRKQHNDKYTQQQLVKRTKNRDSPCGNATKIKQESKK